MADDARIIELYWARDEAAIAESEAGYGGFCRGIALNILSSREDAEECVADTWHSAWNAIPPAIPGVLRAFFGRIVRNLSLDRWRREHARKRFPEMERLICELDECAPAAWSVESEVESMELARALDAYLLSLTCDERTLFIRRYWYGEQVKALAAQCGVTEGALAQRLRRLRLGLRAALEKEDIRI